jgi:hypothetical protein
MGTATASSTSPASRRPGNNAQSESNDVQWVKVTVSSSNPDVFNFEQEVIPGDLVPYVP